MGAMAARVRLGLIQVIRTRAKVATVAVLTRYMIAGPATCLTAWTSFVARLIRSPVFHRS